jgi:hypothetical protein
VIGDFLQEEKLVTFAFNLREHVFGNYICLVFLIGSVSKLNLVLLGVKHWI